MAGELSYEVSEENRATMISLGTLSWRLENRTFSGRSVRKKQSVALLRRGAVLHQDVMDIEKDAERRHYARAVAAKLDGHKERWGRRAEIVRRHLEAIAEITRCQSAESANECLTEGDQPRGIHIGGDYYIGDGGFRYLKRTNGAEFLVPLCNFVAEATEDILRDDGLEEKRYFTLQGRLAMGEPLSQAKVPAAAFSGMSWVNGLWGLAPVISAGNTSRDRVREAIQLNSKEVTKRRIYTHTGWREIDGKMAYLTASGGLGVEGVEVDLEPGLDRYSLPQEPEDVPQAIIASLRFLEIGPLTVTVPLWANMYLAPLCPILLPNFSTWLYGLTGQLKSTLGALALCHYGRFTYKTLPASWSSTANYLEKLLFLAKDCPLVIDDFSPAASNQKAKELEDKAQRVDRAMGDLSGRGRLRADTSVRSPYVPRGLLISTGEQLPSGQSHAARLFPVEVDRSEIDLARLTMAQNESWRYPHALSAFISWLCPQWDHLKVTLNESWEEIRQRAIRERQHLRLPEVVAYLYLGLDIGLAFAEEHGVLRAEKAEELRSDGWAALISLAEKQARRIEEERPIRRFLTVLHELFAQKFTYLKAKDGKEPEDAESLGWVSDQDAQGDTKWRTLPGAEPLGWADELNLYLLPEVSYRRVSRFCQDQGLYFPVKPRTLLEHLAKEGLIRKVGNRYTDQLWAEGNNQRVLRLSRNAVEKFEEF